MAIRYSIIIPVFNQWHLVPRLFDCLRRQSSTNGEFEVLAIDNGSRDFHPLVGLPDNFRILTCDTPGSYAARNKGIEAAIGTCLVFTDADCEPADNWLAEIDHALKTHDRESTLIAGSVHVTVSNGDAPNSYQIYDIVKGIPQEHYVRRGYGATANLCVPVAVIHKIGLFDETRYSGGDADLCRRALKNGFRLVYLPEAIVRHPARDSWHALSAKARRVKGGQLTAGSMRSRMFYFIRSFLPPVLAISRFVSQRHLPGRFRMIAILMQFRIWVVDMQEALRISLGSHPERN